MSYAYELMFIGKEDGDLEQVPRSPLAERMFVVDPDGVAMIMLQTDPYCEMCGNRVNRQTAYEQKMGDDSIFYCVECRWGL